MIPKPFLLLSVKLFAVCANSSFITLDADFSRQGAKAQSSEDLFLLSFASLRLCESYSEFGCGSAALGLRDEMV
jgi:hypothetical protein